MNIRIVNSILFLLLMSLISATWFLRRDFSESNIEILPGMVVSVPFNAFASNTNFPDGKTLQTPGRTSIPREFAPLHYQSTPEDARRAGAELTNPFAAKPQDVLQRGTNLFAVYCQPCHGSGGAGDGKIVQYGFPPPPSLLTEKAVGMKDGQMFHITTFGQNNMPSMASQITRLDRWRVITYVRSLQRQAIAAGQQTTK